MHQAILSNQHVKYEIYSWKKILILEQQVYLCLGLVYKMSLTITIDFHAVFVIKILHRPRFLI